jgi:hypothetical protein
MIDPITKIIGSVPENIKIVEDFLNEEDWLKLIDFCKNIDNDLKTKDHHVYQPIPEDIFNITNRYKKILMSKASELYGLDFIEDGNEVCLFVHPEGSHMMPHTDIVEVTDQNKYLGIDYNNLDSIRKSHKEVPFHWTGHLATLIYINDNYEGGELYFPDRNINIKPKPRMLIMFPGNDNYVHGVSKNKNATRFNLSLFIKFKDF